MKEYNTPILEEIEVEVEDICATSGAVDNVLFGDNKGNFNAW